MAHIFHEMGFAVCMAHREQSHRPSCGCPYECYNNQAFDEMEHRTMLSQASRPFNIFFVSLLGEIAL